MKKHIDSNHRESQHDLITEVRTHYFRRLLIMGKQSLSLLCLITATVCSAVPLTTESAITEQDNVQMSMKSQSSTMWITIGERRFAVTLADTQAAREFADMLPLTLDMEDLNNNEKKFDLPKSLTTNEYQPKTIHNGDIMLWGSRTLVVFYKTFNSPYSYTLLGNTKDSADLPQELGHSNVEIRFSNGE